MSNSEVIGVSTLSITQGVGAFHAFLPPLTDISKADPNDEQFRNTVRIGEFAATALTVGISAMVSNLSGSYIPTVIAGILCLGLIAVYESALNSTAALEN